MHMANVSKNPTQHISGSFIGYDSDSKYTSHSIINNPASDGLHIIKLNRQKQQFSFQQGCRKC